MCASAVQAVGLRGDAIASRDLRRHRHHADQRHSTPSAGVEGAPSGGGRATTRRGLDAPAPGPAGVGGGQHHTLRGTRLTRMLVVTAPAVTTHTNGCFSVWLVATRSEQRATRAGQGAQDITGCRVQRGHKQSFSGSLGTRYMRQPVMLSWPSANLPRRPARLGRARCPVWPAIQPCAQRHALTAQASPTDPSATGSLSSSSPSASKAINSAAAAFKGSG